MKKTIQKITVESVMCAFFLLVPQLTRADEIALGSQAQDANYLTFTAEAENSSITFKWKSGTAISNSTDGVNWSEYAAGTEIALANVGDKVMFKGKDMMTDWDNHFAMTGKITASGSVTSLIDGIGNDSAATLPHGCFSCMFMNCTSLTTAPELIATKLTYSCCEQMFCGCTMLTNAPALPAMTLAKGYYQNMFKNCKALMNAPVLPATKLAEWCYSGMFYCCTALAVAPELPSTSLAIGCYNSMFWRCTALTDAPILSATELVESCYSSMFYGCTKLTNAPMLPAMQLAEYCYGYMFGYCIALTMAPELPAMTLSESCYEQMFYGCTALTDAPKLPARKLASRCYFSMFNGCTSLVVNKNGLGGVWSVPTAATETDFWNTYMFKGTGGDFTGNPEIGKTYYIGAKKEQVGDVTLYRYGDQVGVSYDGELTKEVADTIADKAITNLIIGAGVTKVGDGAFKGWRTLRDVTVSEDCTEVGAQAFYKCPNITNVACKATEPMAVGDYAFYRCNSLEGLSFLANPTWGKTPFSFYSGIYMKDGLPEVYAIPSVKITGYNKQTLMGTNDLSDPNSWEIVTEETRGNYHFFKIVLGE